MKDFYIKGDWGWGAEAGEHRLGGVLRGGNYIGEERGWLLGLNTGGRVNRRLRWSWRVCRGGGSGVERRLGRCLGLGAADKACLTETRSQFRATVGCLGQEGAGPLAPRQTNVDGAGVACQVHAQRRLEGRGCHRGGWWRLCLGAGPDGCGRHWGGRWRPCLRGILRGRWWSRK